MTVRYWIKLEPDDNDTLPVTCPALPEVATFGEDEADALRHARNAIEEALAAHIADGLDIPAQHHARAAGPWPCLSWRHSRSHSIGRCAKPASPELS